MNEPRITPLLIPNFGLFWENNREIQNEAKMTQMAHSQAEWLLYHFGSFYQIWLILWNTMNTDSLFDISTYTKTNKNR